MHRKSGNGSEHRVRADPTQRTSGSGSKRSKSASKNLQLKFKSAINSSKAIKFGKVRNYNWCCTARERREGGKNYKKDKMSAGSERVNERNERSSSAGCARSSGDEGMSEGQGVRRRGYEGECEGEEGGGIEAGGQATKPHCSAGCNTPTPPHPHPSRARSGGAARRNRAPDPPPTPPPGLPLPHLTRRSGGQRVIGLVHDAHNALGERIGVLLQSILRSGAVDGEHAPRAVRPCGDVKVVIGGGGGGGRAFGRVEGGRGGRGRGVRALACSRAFRPRHGGRGRTRGGRRKRRGSADGVWREALVLRDEGEVRREGFCISVSVSAGGERRIERSRLRIRASDAWPQAHERLEPREEAQHARLRPAPPARPAEIQAEIEGLRGSLALERRCEKSGAAEGQVGRVESRRYDVSEFNEREGREAGFFNLADLGLMKKRATARGCLSGRWTGRWRSSASQPAEDTFSSTATGRLCSSPRPVRQALLWLTLQNSSELALSASDSARWRIFINTDDI
ncbi:hypothetical protein FB451DRAFT_1367191 [Mycena latifolia]|nr:hypothetical protein FB451DRAFT_1367191 [Mycena latifolia]